MASGWTLYESEERWYHYDFTDAALSDGKLTIEIPVEDGDTVMLTAASPDGVTYRGDYRYREGSQSNGEIRLDRFSGPAGDVLVGTWQEAGSTNGVCVIKVNNPGRANHIG